MYEIFLSISISFLGPLPVRSLRLRLQLQGIFLMVIPWFDLSSNKGAGQYTLIIPKKYTGKSLKVNFDFLHLHNCRGASLKMIYIYKKAQAHTLTLCFSKITKNIQLLCQVETKRFIS